MGRERLRVWLRDFDEMRVKHKRQRNEGCVWEPFWKEFSKNSF